MCKPGQPCPPVDQSNLGELLKKAMKAIGDHTADMNQFATNAVDAKAQFDELKDDLVLTESDLQYVLTMGLINGGDIQHLGPDDRPDHVFLLNPAGKLTLSAVRTKTEHEGEIVFHVLALPGFMKNFDAEEAGALEISL